MSWLDCGDQPAETMLSAVEELALALGGELTTIERTSARDMPVALAFILSSDPSPPQD